MTLGLFCVPTAWPWCRGWGRGGQTSGRIQETPQRHGGLPQTSHLTAGGTSDVSWSVPVISPMFNLEKILIWKRSPFSSFASILLKIIFVKKKRDIAAMLKNYFTLWYTKFPNFIDIEILSKHIVCKGKSVFNLKSVKLYTF